MDSKEHLVASCDPSSTKTIEIVWDPNVSTPKIKKERIESSDEEELPLSVYKHRYEPMESKEYINQYDCKDYVLKQVKKEFPEDPQAGCSGNSNIVEEDKKSLKLIDRQNVKVENTEEGVFINIKQEHDDKIYEIPIKKEKLEDQELLDNNGDADAQYDSLLVPREIQKILDARKLKKPENNKKKQRQREQNRGKLQQRETEIRKRIRYLQSITVSPTTSNIYSIEIKNEEIIADISQTSSDLDETQTPSIQRSEQDKEMHALQKKRERQQRYRERNREKLKQREVERKKRTGFNNRKKIAAVSPSSSGLDGTQTPSIQRKERPKENDALQRRREYQKRYREENRERLRQREAERRRRLGFNIGEGIAAISPSLSGLDGTQASIQRNELAKRMKALQKKRERQQRYREQNREKLKQREAERRRRLGSNSKKKSAVSPSSSSLERTQAPSIQKNKRSKAKNDLQRKKEYQRKYREQNREKLKQREADRRRRLKHTEIIIDHLPFQI